MGLRKCPKCELNYIRDDQKLCDVCSRKHKLSEDDDNEIQMCIECGENPAMKGRDICAQCYKESLRQEQILKQRKSAVPVKLSDVMDDEEVPLEESELPEPVIDEDEEELEDMDEEYDDDELDEDEADEEDMYEDEFYDEDDDEDDEDEDDEDEF